MLKLIKLLWGGFPVGVACLWGATSLKWMGANDNSFDMFGVQELPAR